MEYKITVHRGLSGSLIPRVIHKEFGTPTTKKYNVIPDILSMFKNSELEFNVYVDEYRLVFNGIVVQGNKGSLMLVGPGSRLRFIWSSSRFCRWHNGSLAQRDDPLKRKYCMNSATSFLGYCNVHDDSIRALYDRCVGLTGTKALEYCRRFDRVMKGLEYVVYLLVQPNGKVKVGLTRKIRWLDRIAEQQHVIAAIIDVTDSLYDARLLELRLAKHRLLSDKGVRSYINRSPIGISQALHRLKTVIEGLNLDINDLHEIVRIPPPQYDVKDEYERGNEAILLDYWGGYVYLKEPQLSRVYVLKATYILHRNTLDILGSGN